MTNEHHPIGSSLEDWLEEEGLLESATNYAIKSILAEQVSQHMKANGLSKVTMARRMNTSRSALDRLLDPDNESVTLMTLQNAARAIGAHLEMKLVFDKEAA